MARLPAIAAALLAPLLAVLLPATASAQASPSAFTWASRYDELRRVTGTIAPDPDGTGSLHYAAVRNTYDDAGRLIRVEKGELAGWQAETIAPSAWTGFTVFSQVDTTYDVMDRKLKDVVSSGGTSYEVTQYSYDADGRLDCTAVRMNSATWSALPASACTLATTSSTYGPDRITKNVYDAAGQLLKVVKAFGQTTANGLPQLQQDYVTNSYTNDGKQQTLKDADGNLTTYTYDGFDRLVAWAYPSKTATGSSAPCTVGTIAEATDGFGNAVTGPSETKTTGDDCEKYAYDRNGNRAKLMKRDGNVIRYAFDALNRNSVKDIPGGTAADVYYGYDLRGLQTFARFGSASGAGLTSSYDGFGQLASSSNNLGGSALTLFYQYDADGNRTRLTYPDGVYIGYGYDGLDRMTTASWTTTGTTPFLTITYDNQGRRGSTVRGSSNTGYTYDAVSRLASDSQNFASGTSNLTSGYSYNPASQIVTKSRSNNVYAFTGYVSVSRAYVANGLNQYTSAGPAAFSYDANGNLTGDGSSSYGYDVENRLTTKSGGLTLAYDPAGRLWQSSGGASGTTRYLYDGDALIAEYNGSGTMIARYAFGANQDEPVLIDGGSALDCSQTRFPQPDAQGSIIGLADCWGAPQAINTYDEYGIPGAGNVGRFQYTGQLWLPDLGMYYYKARIYSPTLGRFMQTDPIGYGDQNNLYAYVENDPIDGRDPSGMVSECTGTRLCSSTNAFVAGSTQQLGEGPQDSKSGTAKTATIAGAAGVAASGLEHASGKTTVRIGNNGLPKFSPKGFRANQYTRAARLSRIGSVAGRYVLGISIGADIIGVKNGEISLAKFGENRVFDALGARGGPAGAVIAGMYWGFETFYPGGANQFVRDGATSARSAINDSTAAFIANKSRPILSRCGCEQ